MSRAPVFAVCGKGGVGKTVVSALLGRCLLEQGVRPLLLIDADPVSGLVSAIGERAARTLADVREDVIAAARGSDDAQRAQLAQRLDYLVLEALVEREGFSLLAMGRSRERGCFCPVNTLLREAIDTLTTPFAAVLVDAEAGIEQINREVTRGVTRIIGVVDGSQRSLDTLAVIASLVGGERLVAVANRGERPAPDRLPPGVALLGSLPEDATLRDFDRAGRSLWTLPPDNPAVVAAATLATALDPRGLELGLAPEGGDA